jgi:hypothetical protein
MHINILAWVQILKKKDNQWDENKWENRNIRDKYKGISEYKKGKQTQVLSLMKLKLSGIGVLRDAAADCIHIYC